MIVKNLKFPVIMIYIWINNSYRKATTEKQLIKLFFEWLEVSETSKNEIKAIAYKKSANALYQEITGKSYQSVILI